MDNTIKKVPIHLKMALTIREAAEYSNIGINKINSLLRAPNCPFVLFVGAKSRLSDITIQKMNRKSKIQA